MTIQTHIQQALDRVADEQAHIVEKQTAFDEFERIVRDLSVTPSSGEGVASQAPTGGSLTVSVSPTHTTQPSEDRCQRVREAFAETFRPYSTGDFDKPESVVETIGDELRKDLAMILAPGSDGQFTAPTKQALLSAVAERQQELAVMERALEAEDQFLRSARGEIQETIGRLIEANETPLTDLGFDDLQTYHEELARHRTRCNEVACDRQEFLHGTTSYHAAVGISHRTLVEYLYAELPVDYPVLVTVARLAKLCEECQRVVRDHLVRRA